MKTLSMLYLRQWQRFARLDYRTRRLCVLTATLGVAWWTLTILNLAGVIT